MGQQTSDKGIAFGLAINAAVNFSRDILLSTKSSACDALGVSVRIFYGSPATTVENLVEFAKSGIDGLILCGFRRSLAASFVNLAKDLPPVVLGLYAPLEEGEVRRSEKIKTLVFDNDLIGSLAADYFLGHGLLNFAFLGCNVLREKLACEIRFSSFRRRIEEKSSLPATIAKYISGNPSSNEDFWVRDEACVVAWLKSLPHPCGLFVNGEIEAFAILKLCQQLGVDVPRQIEILCVDNSFGFCERASPTISNIHVDFNSTADIAIKMLLSMIGKTERATGAEEVVKLQLEIRDRGSTASGRGYGLVAERAKEYVRTHACEGIGVPDVVRQVGASRRIVEKRVREATGRSVLELIRSVRLEEVCRLLKETDLPISEIMARSGYQINSNLSVIFKRVHGMSMRQYRALNRQRGCAGSRPEGRV